MPEQLGPCLPSLHDIGAKHLLQDSVSPLGLPICLRMVSRGHREPRPNYLHERGPKCRCETWISVANDLLRHAKVAYYSVEKEGSDLPRTKRGVTVAARCKAYKLR